MQVGSSLQRPWRSRWGFVGLITTEAGSFNEWALLKDLVSRQFSEEIMKVTGGWEQHNTGRNVEISISIRLVFKATIFFVEYYNRLRF